MDAKEQKLNVLLNMLGMGDLSKVDDDKLILIASACLGVYLLRHKKI